MICFFGGTFDPVHLGHLRAAQAVRAHLELASLRMILSARPGHRSAPVASLSHRWRMLCIACQEEVGLVPDDTETKRSAPSYTVDTLLSIRAGHPGEAIAWTLGSDAFIGLPSWHRWRDVLSLTNLVILARPGVDDLTGSDPDLVNLLNTHRVDDLRGCTVGGVLVLNDIALLDTSATQVRERLANHRPVETLVPPEVAAYINEHDLYGDTGEAKKAV
ncbi:MAG: nicotinate-nucleotide adenylyltransferase [Proteobacteria bacterium]|nr:nicotinate-nucleotide adenylyltransferase [Pseudomonadota bacterium]